MSSPDTYYTTNFFFFPQPELNYSNLKYPQKGKEGYPTHPKKNLEAEKKIRIKNLRETGI